jgi:hypothetical protein
MNQFITNIRNIVNLMKIYQQGAGFSLDLFANDI